ncbi:MAG: 2-amino-4-hydroxy-6-hydroxymethyldihydropteridine diphosphokinase [Pseudomonadota bacterium]
MITVAIGIGSNLGDRQATLTSALSALDAHPRITLQKVSTFYETDPWGPVPQGPYLNACVLVATDLDAEPLLDVFLEIERVHGRERGERWGPRTLDIDMLTYGDQDLTADRLTVPHPRMLDRPFVLVPLTEIAPDLEVRGRPIVEWLSEVDASGVRPFTPVPKLAVI